MAKIVRDSDVLLEKYGVNCKRHLAYSEIQAIVDGVKQFDTWAERQQNKDMMVLMFATDMDVAELEKYGHVALLECGLIDEVRRVVDNYAQVDEAIEYTQSTKRALAQIVKLLPEYIKKFETKLRAGEEDGGKK